MTPKLILEKETQVRAGLSDFLLKLDDTYEQSFRAEDWNILFADIRRSLMEWKFQEAVTAYGDPKLTYISGELNSMLMPKEPLSSDKKDDTYESLKSYLQDILNYLPRTWFGVTKWDTIPFWSYLGFPLAFVLGFPLAFVLGFPSAFIPGFPSAFIPEYSITITFFVAVIGLLVTYYCKISEDKDYKKKKEENGYKKMKEEKDKEYAGNKKILTKKLKELEKVKKMIDGESDVYDKKRKTLTNEIELLGKKIEEVVKELGENSKDRRLSGKIGNIARGRGVQFRIFAAVFGIIAALAISAPIEALLDDGCESTPSQLCPKDIRKITDWPKFLMGQQVILTSGFFAIGILFYHGGILTLSGELAPLIEEGRKGIAFVSSLIVFVEGIILFVASSVTDDLVQFSYWICVLLVFDITWLIINLYARIDMTFQWLHMDVILLLFLVFAFLIPLQLDSSIMPTSAAYLAVFALFLLRSMIDYKIGWKYWTKVSTQ